MSISIYETKQTDTVQTTDATPTPFPVAEISLPTSSIAKVTINILARNGAGDNAKVWSRVYAVRRAVDGTIALTGTPLTLLAEGTLGSATWAVALSVTGGGVQVVVTGQAGQTISWSCCIEALIQEII